MTRHPRTAAKPLVIVDPSPQTVSRIFSPEAMARLTRVFEVVEVDSVHDPVVLDAYLPDAFAIVGQPDLPADRLRAAPQLRAVLNVEGNFFPNVDYAVAFDHGVYVLGCGPAYAQAVAEYSVGLALDLARGITREDRAFRERREQYVLASNTDAILLGGSQVGLLGFGNLGRSIRALLRPFNPTIRVYDPWLPDSELHDHGVIPSSLADTLAGSQFLFVLATVTPDSRHLLGASQLDLLPDKARLILVSRAPVVDYDALLQRVAAGRLLAGIDVWPEEPMPADHPVRDLDGVVLSAHRAGGIPAAFLTIGDMVVDDLLQLVRDLPPVRMQVAARELVTRYRNRPVT
jgi:phosphoglycerate dehydrogenase-like enzyme